MMSNQVTDKRGIFKGQPSVDGKPCDKTSPRIRIIIHERMRLSEKIADVGCQLNRLIQLEGFEKTNRSVIDGRMYIREVDIFTNDCTELFGFEQQANFPVGMVIEITSAKR